MIDSTGLQGASGRSGYTLTPAERVEAVHADAVPPAARETVALWLHGRPWSTVRTYSRDVADLFLAIEPRRLEDVTLRDLHQFDDAMVERYDSSATARRKMCSVKSLFGFAHRLGLIERNPAAALRVPRASRRLAERILAQEDVLRAIALADGKSRVILRLLYASGARLEELARLRWRDVRPIGERGHAAIALVGKGGKERVVLVSAGTYADLQRWRAGAPDDAPVFRGRGGAPLSPRQIERVVKRAAIAAGLPADVSPHWLRHAHVSHALERGCPIHLVKATVGHASIATTGEYADARPNDSSGLFLPV